MQRFIHLEGFLSEEEQFCLSTSTFERHQVCQKRKLGSEYEIDNDSEWKNLESSTASIPLNMGLNCTGGPFVDMEPAVRYSKRAFGEASRYFASIGQKEVSGAIYRLCNDEVELTGISLLYGPKGKMLAHYDSPTQPGRRDEWLVGFTVGADTDFRCNDKIIRLTSGDALVMDSMAVLHGVESIDNGFESVCRSSKYELPFPGSRLGVLLWQSAQTIPNVSKNKVSSDIKHEGLKNLFATDTDSDYSEDVEK